MLNSPSAIDWSEKSRTSRMQLNHSVQCISFRLILVFFLVPSVGFPSGCSLVLSPSPSWLLWMRGWVGEFGARPFPGSPFPGFPHSGLPQHHFMTAKVIVEVVGRLSSSLSSSRRRRRPRLSASPPLRLPPPSLPPCARALLGSAGGR